MQEAVTRRPRPQNAPSQRTSAPFRYALCRARRFASSRRCTLLSRLHRRQQILHRPLPAPQAHLRPPTLRSNTLIHHLHHVSHPPLLTCSHASAFLHPAPVAPFRTRTAAPLPPLSPTATAPDSPPSSNPKRQPPPPPASLALARSLPPLAPGFAAYPHPPFRVCHGHQPQ